MHNVRIICWLFITVCFIKVSREPNHKRLLQLYDFCKEFVVSWLKFFITNPTIYFYRPSQHLHFVKILCIDIKKIIVDSYHLHIVLVHKNGWKETRFNFLLLDTPWTNLKQTMKNICVWYFQGLNTKNRRMSAKLFLKSPILHETRFLG